MHKLLVILLSFGFALTVPARAQQFPTLPPRTEPSASAQLGKLLFFDESLSALGNMSCATCHDPRHAYAAPNDLAVQLGGPSGREQGARAVPSLRYQEYTPPYSDAAYNPDAVTEPGPGGGFMADGRAPTLAQQARLPLLAANEMANKSADDVARKLQRAPYAAQFRAAFGKNVFKNPALAFQRALETLQTFQLEDESFHPYTSKFDLYQNNKIGGTLTAAEQRGLEVYENPKKGNCFACHYGGPGLGGSIALFTDFTYAAIGVPRNPEIARNADASYYDLGICARADHQRPASAKFCGMFKTPTLRNVAARGVFFHNGRFKSLPDVLRFYNTRDAQPELWYPTRDGVVQKFDDLPEAYRKNLDRQAPLDGRAVGAAAAMSEQDLSDLLAFLQTLTDADVVRPEP
jgi:cytochrome c peroxidase